MNRVLSVLTICVVMLSLSSLVGCSFFKTKVIPKVKEAAATKLTAAIVKVGECKAESEVKADVYKLLKMESDEGLIAKAVGSESSPEGAQEEGVVSEICKAASRLALPALLSKGVPPKWECALTDLNSRIGELAENACGKVPF